ncbi:MAG: UDP-N-acetylmuramoyl-L-alanine--D-glutamate ligase [Ruminococcaceae bacterium]|nr:UDP-N-acetylmuramoyl-L-alanine--D-glutamate ligase [Oscillospiraceae bacterium]
MNIDAFFDSIKGKSVAFCGIGITNTPLAEMFLHRGFEVTVCDRRDPSDPGAAIEKLRSLGAAVRLGSDYLEGLEADILFRTPGMNWNDPALAALRGKGTIVTSEMELFFRLCPAHTIAVTGSCGKTTVSTIIARMLEAAGKKVWLGGSIGRAMLPDVDKMSPEDWVVCELSSFQLISMRESPEIALITNISPNHLDTHGSMQEYIDAKSNIFLHQSAFDRLVINADCAISSRLAGSSRGECMTFSRTVRPEYGAYADGNGDIFFIGRSGERRIMNTRDIRVPGMHNVENFLSAICVTDGLVSDEDIVSVAHLFCGVEHCAEFVRCVDGVCYYNDSIATTPDRTIRGMLSLFDRRIILIAGGHDKKLPFEQLGEAVSRSVSKLILIGDTADAIEAAVKASPDYDADATVILRAADMAQAVALAAENAGDGDVVALSPACSSFDMFRNFDERGKCFKKQVERIRSRAESHQDDDDDYNL